MSEQELGDPLRGRATAASAVEPETSPVSSKAGVPIAVGPGLPGFVVLGRAPGGNAWQGVVEHSFSMTVEAHRVRFWWTGTAHDNFLGLKFEIDGKEDAAGQLKHFRQTRPDWTFEIFDVASPDIPVKIDWARWLKTTDKYERRNPLFEMRDIDAELLADANAWYSDEQRAEIARAEQVSA